MIYRDFYDGGYKIFGIYSIREDGSCECLNPKCTAQGKHPRTSNWQSTPMWDEEQLECMEEMGSYDTGYGVLCMVEFNKDSWFSQKLIANKFFSFLDLCTSALNVLC